MGKDGSLSGFSVFFFWGGGVCSLLFASVFLPALHKKYLVIFRLLECHTSATYSSFFFSLIESSVVSGFGVPKFTLYLAV